MTKKYDSEMWTPEEIEEDIDLEEIVKAPITQDYLDPDEPNPILDNQLIIEGLDTEEGKAEDGSTKTMNYDNPSMIDTILMRPF